MELTREIIELIESKLQNVPKEQLEEIAEIVKNIDLVDMARQINEQSIYKPEFKLPKEI